ncbi:unnamed protein product [Pichia kudriavzevii]
MEDPLVPLEKDTIRVVITPQEHSENNSSWVYTSKELIHPVSQERNTFVIARDGCNPITELYAMDKINWRNHTIKNNSSTPDGKPYSCLFITYPLSTATSVPATVLGKHPDIYVMSSFSPLFFLIAYFKSAMVKAQNDGENKRLLSYEDLIENICNDDETISMFVNEFQMDLRPYLECICELVSLPSMDSDDESTDPFYKPSLDKILNIIDERINSLVHLFQTENGIASLKWRMDTMYPKGLTDELRSLFWKRQAISIMSLFVDEWYINEACKKFNYKFTELDQFISASKVDQQAQQAMDESLEMMHEGMIKSNNKRFKPTPKKINTTEKKKTGALDMFFKRKESN